MFFSKLQMLRKIKIPKNHMNLNVERTLKITVFGILILKIVMVLTLSIN